MAFKINISHKGRTFKLETENESLIRMKIGDKINGDLISPDFDGYELEITGTSDIAGFPGIKGEIAPKIKLSDKSRDKAKFPSFLLFLGKILKLSKRELAIERAR